VNSISPHILIIEDDSLTAWHLTMLLREWKYVVRRWSIRQLLSAKNVHFHRPDLILLMENSNKKRAGRNEGLLAAILISWQIPVLIISAMLPSENWLHHPKVSYLPKPFGANQLRERIEEALGREPKVP
jgi:DNA-binding response OmpR family regulator